MTPAENVPVPAFAPDSLIVRLGITVLQLGADTVVGTMPVDGNRQIHGLLHGGATAALAETLGSLGAMVHAGEGGAAVGVDLNITHHRAVSEGVVTGVATALHRGRTVATYAVSVTDQDNRVVASGRISCVVKTRS